MNLLLRKTTALREYSIRAGVWLSKAIKLASMNKALLRCHTRLIPQRNAAKGRR
jgi:hypothetical protein